jgi:predicted membrane protein
MKNRNIFWGVVLICAALLILVDSIGSQYRLLSNISVVRLILGVVCVGWAVDEIVRRRLSMIFFPIAFAFLLFEGEIAQLFGIGGRFISTWVVLAAALLLTIGTGMIFPKDGTGEKHRIMGASTKYIDCVNFTRENIENNMASYEIFFENTASYQGGGTLNIENNMGSCTVHAPREWHIIANIDNSMGSIKMPADGDPNGKPLYITGSNSMGGINIELI